MDKQIWTDKILSKADPHFKPRWEVYNEVVQNHLCKEKVWIDCGCGNNETVEMFGQLAGQAVGIDLTNNVEFKHNFVKGDIRKLPVHSGFADLITLRFVVEHFKNSLEYLDEFKRVLKKDGKIVIITTNILSPFIFIPRAIFPHSIKNKILTSIFKVKDEDVFPTYHRLNSPGKFFELQNEFIVKEIRFISDINNTRKWMFLILLCWHKLTSIKTLNRFRTNMLVILEKK